MDPELIERTDADELREADLAKATIDLVLTGIACEPPEHRMGLYADLTSMVAGFAMGRILPIGTPQGENVLFLPSNRFIIRRDGRYGVQPPDDNWWEWFDDLGHACYWYVQEVQRLAYRAAVEDE